MFFRFFYVIELKFTLCSSLRFFVSIMLLRYTFNFTASVFALKGKMVCLNALSAVAVQIFQWPINLLVFVDHRFHRGRANFAYSSVQIRVTWVSCNQIEDVFRA